MGPLNQKQNKQTMTGRGKKKKQCKTRYLTSLLEKLICDSSHKRNDLQARISEW